MKKSILFLVCIGMFFFNQGYTQDGGFDETFGENGWVDFEFPQNGGRANSIAQLTDGSYLVAGRLNYSTSKPSLVKFREDGVLDISFGSNGVLQYDNFSNFKSIIAQQNNSFLCYERIHTSSKFIKFNSNGELDTNFGDNGIIEIENTSFNLKLLNGLNHSIIIAYTKEVFGEAKLFIHKYLSNGSLDFSFGTQGVQALNISETSNAFKIKQNESGEFFIFTYKEINSMTEQCFIKLNSFGNYDLNFGNNGVAIISNPEIIYLRDFDVNSNSMIICGLTIPTTNKGERENKFIRFTASGELDTNFGNNGIQEIDISYRSIIKLITQSDNKFIIQTRNIGSPPFFEENYLRLQRFLENGNNDPSFLSYDLWQSFVDIDLLLQNNNKIILLTESYWLNTPDDEFFQIWRFNNSSELGINENKLHKFTIYPNPSKETFNINFQNLENDLPYQVVDVTGKVIVKGIFTQLENTLKLSQVKTGVYFLQVGGESYKLIKQ